MTSIINKNYLSPGIILKPLQTHLVGPLRHFKLEKGSFDPSKTDNILRTFFKKKSASKTAPHEEIDSSLSKEEKAIELLKGMTPEQIMAVISAINK